MSNERIDDWEYKGFMEIENANGKYKEYIKDNRFLLLHTLPSEAKELLFSMNIFKCSVSFSGYREFRLIEADNNGKFLRFSNTTYLPDLNDPMSYYHYWEYSDNHTKKISVFELFDLPEKYANIIDELFDFICPYVNENPYLYINGKAFQSKSGIEQWEEKQHQLECDKAYNSKRKTKKNYKKIINL